MLNKNVTVILKDGGGAPLTSKKKKKEDEEKTVAVIKDDSSPSLAGGVARATGGVANRDSAQNGNRAQSYAESRQPTPTAVSHGTSLKREANDTPTPTTQKRQFTYDDYITATAAEKAKGMLGRYFKTGEVPSNLSTSLKERLSGNTSPSLAGGVANATGGVANRAASNTGNTSPIPAKPDYSSPTAAWRTPETFQAIPWSDFGSLNKYDRKAYLKAYAENSQREKAQRDAMTQAEAQRINQERSDKMLADHFYGRMLKGEQIDVKALEPKTLGALQDRAYEDYSKGAISYDQYIDLPIHVFKSLDNGQAKVYNGNTDNSTMPLMQTSGFDRYRTERYDYVPANYVGNKKPSSGNASQSDEQSKNNLTTPFPISWEIAPISPYNYKNQQMYAISHQGKPMPEEMFATSKKNVNPIEENKRQAEIQKNVVEMMKVCLSSEENVSRLKEINDAYGYIEFGADVGEMTFEALYKYVRNGIKESQPPANIGVGTWAKKVDADLKWLDETFEPFLKLTKDTGSSKLSNLDLLGLGADVGLGVLNNISSGADVSTTIADAFVDFSYAAGGMTVGAAAGSIFPGAGTAIGALIGGLVGIGIDYFYEKFTEETSFYGKSLKDHSKENWREIFDSILPF